MMIRDIGKISSAKCLRHDKDFSSEVVKFFTSKVLFIQNFDSNSGISTSAFMFSFSNLQARSAQWP